MVRNTFFIIFNILCFTNIFNAAYKKSGQQFLQKIAKPQLTKFKKINPYSKAAGPLSVVQINSLLLKQPLEVQNKITKHPFYEDLILEVNNLPVLKFANKNQLNFDEKTLLKLEIFMYCMNHPQEAEEMMNFYQEIKDAHNLIKDRLKILPSHTQEFFKQQVEKYLNSEIEDLQGSDIHSTKIKTLKLYPYVIPALKIGFSVLMLTIFFIISTKVISMFKELNIEELNLESPEEKQLLDIFNLLVDALNLEPIKLYHLKDDTLGEYAAYRVFPFIKPNYIYLTPHFFKVNLDAQIFILLHELRHYQQGQITIPQDVIEYAKKQSVNPLEFGLIGLLVTGFFWSRAMMEFDADLFAARQMKDYPHIHALAHELRGKFYIQEILDAWFQRVDLTFNPQTGYLSKEMISKESPYGSRKLWWLYIEKIWDKFINSQPNENMYLRYVPEHLKKAAIQNRATKEKAKQSPQEASQLFDKYIDF